MDDIRDDFEEELGEDELHAGDDSLLADEDEEHDEEETDPLMNGFHEVEGEEPEF
jgi:hypothetical protein